MKRCVRCEEEKPLTDFYTQGANKWHAWCKPCYRARRKERYPEIRERMRAQVRKTARALRYTVLSHYSGGAPLCACCGEDTLEFLGIDHVNNNGAEHRKTLEGRNIVRWLRRNGYPSGYQVLCHNCNLAKGFYGECPHVRVQCEALALVRGEEPPRGKKRGGKK